MIVPVRRELVFAATLNPTVWDPTPFPLAGALIVIHEYEVVAFHEQPLPDETGNEPLPPVTLIDCKVDVRE